MKMNAVYVLIGLILGLVACSCLGKTREGFSTRKINIKKTRNNCIHCRPIVLEA